MLAELDRRCIVIEAKKKSKEKIFPKSAAVTYSTCMAGARTEHNSAGSGGSSSFNNNGGSSSSSKIKKWTHFANRFSLTRAPGFTLLILCIPSEKAPWSGSSRACAV